MPDDLHSSLARNDGHEYRDGIGWRSSLRWMNLLFDCAAWHLFCIPTESHGLRVCISASFASFFCSLAFPLVHDTQTQIAAMQ